jgi:hypothetical protein
MQCDAQPGWPASAQDHGDILSPVKYNTLEWFIMSNVFLVDFIKVCLKHIFIQQNLSKLGSVIMYGQTGIADFLGASSAFWTVSKSMKCVS